MSDQDLGALIVIGFFVAIVLWAMKRPSQKELDKQRREKEHELEMSRLQKEHQIEMERMEREREEIASRPRPPSGRGKVVKARKV